MPIADTNDLATLVLSLLPPRYRALVSPGDVAEKLKDLLYGEKNYWRSGTPE